MKDIYTLLGEFCYTLCGCPPVRMVFRLSHPVESTGLSGVESKKCPTPDRRYLIVASQMTVTQQMTVTAEFQDKKGNPAPVDGVPTWQTDNSDLLELTSSADGLSCVAKAVGMIGVVNVQ